MNRVTPTTEAFSAQRSPPRLVGNTLEFEWAIMPCCLITSMQASNDSALPFGLKECFPEHLVQDLRFWRARLLHMFLTPLAGRRNRFAFKTEERGNRLSMPPARCPTTNGSCLPNGGLYRVSYAGILYIAESRADERGISATPAMLSLGETSAITWLNRNSVPT